MSCLYTAQGVVVCSKTNIEHFIEEKSNMSAATNNNNVINSAIQNKYCVISSAIDPGTNKVTFLFKKECK